MEARNGNGSAASDLAAIEVNIGNSFEKREVEDPAARKKCGTAVQFIEAVSGLLRRSVFENNGCLIVRRKIDATAAAPRTVVARKNKLAAGAVDLTKVDRAARREIETPDILVGFAARNQLAVTRKPDQRAAGNGCIVRVIKREGRIQEVEFRAGREPRLIRTKCKSAARQIHIDCAVAGNCIGERQAGAFVDIDDGAGIRKHNCPAAERTGARKRQNGIGTTVADIDRSAPSRFTARSRIRMNDEFTVVKIQRTSPQNGTGNG